MSFRSPNLRALRSAQHARSIVGQQQRSMTNDLVIERSGRRAGNPSAIVKSGPPSGGRSAQSGHVATVFGCTGFLGRYVVAKLAKAGTQVVVPYRDEDDKRHLKVMGDLGQVVPLEWDIRNAQQIAECVRHSDVVYNLTGRDWETRNFSFEDVNVRGAELIAQVTADQGVSRLVHVSHMNADVDSPSKFYRTKAQGERVVRDAFPTATIVRPAPLFGAEDWLLNAIASYPTLFHLNHGATRTRPAHALDVAEALSVMLNAPKTSDASTFVLPGPATYTYANLIKLVEALTLKPHKAPTLPKPIAMLIAGVLERALWWPTISRDEVTRKYIHDKYTEVKSSNANAPAGWESASELGAGLENAVGVDGEPVKSWSDLGIQPELVEEHAIKYLRRYRSAATFDAPVEMGTFKPPKTYHVVE